MTWKGGTVRIERTRLLFFLTHPVLLHWDCGTGLGLCTCRYSGLGGGHVVRLHMMYLQANEPERRRIITAMPQAQTGRKATLQSNICGRKLHDMSSLTSSFFLIPLLIFSTPPYRCLCVFIWSLSELRLSWWRIPSVWGSPAHYTVQGQAGVSARTQTTFMLWMFLLPNGFFLSFLFSHVSLYPPQHYHHHHHHHLSSALNGTADELGIEFMGKPTFHWLCDALNLSFASAWKKPHTHTRTILHNKAAHLGKLL